MHNLWVYFRAGKKTPSEIVGQKIYISKAVHRIKPIPKDKVFLICSLVPKRIIHICMYISTVNMFLCF